MTLLRIMYRTRPTRSRANSSPEMVTAPDCESIRPARVQAVSPTTIPSEAIFRRFIPSPPSGRLGQIVRAARATPWRDASRNRRVDAGPGPIRRPWSVSRLPSTAMIAARWSRPVGRTDRAASSPPIPARAAAERWPCASGLPRGAPATRRLAALHRGDVRELVRTPSRRRRARTGSRSLHEGPAPNTL